MSKSYLIDGYKFIVQESKDNSIALTAICQLNYSIFETKGQALEKIKGNTVETAFRKESPIISCNCQITQINFFVAKNPSF